MKRLHIVRTEKSRSVYREVAGKDSMNSHSWDCILTVTQVHLMENTEG